MKKMPDANLKLIRIDFDVHRCVELACSEGLGNKIYIDNNLRPKSEAVGRDGANARCV